MLEDIGNVIFKLRTEVFKENARDFSARCGISKSCLLSIEQGITIHPTNETISKIENGTDISFEEFRIDPKIKIDKSKRDSDLIWF